jgi:hypothetical protein
LGEEEIDKMTLHYLNNVINIELFLSRRAENKEDLRLKLAQSANKYPWMGEISIWLN